MNTNHVQRLIEDWIAFHRLSSDDQETSPLRFAEYDVSKLAQLEPERCMQVIAGVFQRDQSDAIVQALAAGPLEDLLQEHGEDAARLFERELRKTPQIAVLLGGVWGDAFDPRVKLWLESKRKSRW